jgi:ribonuclease-3
MATQMNAYVAGVENVIGCHFTDPNKLWEALQAAGSPVQFIGSRRISDGHKRLALIGDSVLKLALISHLYVGTDSKGK